MVLGAQRDWVQYQTIGIRQARGVALTEEFNRRLKIKWLQIRDVEGSKGHAWQQEKEETLCGVTIAAS